MTARLDDEPRPVGTGRVGVSRDGDVGIIRLQDPDRRNALSLELSQDLAAAVEILQAPLDSVAAIIIHAVSPVFCAGGVLDDLLAPRATIDEVTVGVRALSNVAVPTVAAVDGPAIGAGVNLPLACDVVVASEGARFDPRFLDVGVHPGGGHLWRITRTAGRQVAAALVLFGETLDARSAKEHGLIWDWVPGDDCLPLARRLATRAAARPGEVVVATKRSLQASLELATLEQATSMEATAQEWSMRRPQFPDLVRTVARRMSQRGDRR